MSFLGFTGLVNFITSTILGSVILFKKPRTNLRNSYFLVNVSVAIFSFGYFMWQFSSDIETATLWFKVLTSGIILINVIFLQFVFQYVGIARKKRFELAFYYFLSLVFIILNINSQLFSIMEPRFGLGYWPVPTFYFNLYLLFWVWQCLYGFSWFLVGFKGSKGFEREQRKYLILGAAVAFFGGASNWPMWYGINSPPYMNILISLYVIIVAYAIIKYRFMDIKVVLTRAGIFLIVYTVILGLPLYIGYKTDYSFNSFLLLFGFATSGPIIYQYLQKKAEDMLLSKQRSYQNMFLQAAREFLREKDLNKIIKIIVYGVINNIDVNYAAFFLVDKENGFFKLKFAKGDHNFPDNFTLSEDDSLIEQLQQKKRVLLYNELPDYFNQFSDTPAQLIIPSFIDDKLLAFLIMGEKNDKSFYTVDDISTFEIISHQAALAIENCLYYNEKEKVQERLFQTEKSAFIGGMAEGVAHQINNRLNYFSLAATELNHSISKFNEKSPESIKQNNLLDETFSTIEEISKELIDNVKRTNGVIKGVLNFANLTRKDDNTSEIFFDEIINAAIDLAQVKHEIDEFPIEIEVDSTNIIYGKMTQFLESLFNILDNSYEAIEEKKMFRLNDEEREKFQPLIKIKLTQKENMSIIEISDNGIGIKDEDKRKIFAPYYTTKSSFKASTGSGIGLYEISRFIQENHKGRIWFESEYMEGTSFFIEIPRKLPD